MGGLRDGWHETDLSVRLTEVDAFQVVWHGRYVEYFEVGRHDLAERFGLGPREWQAAGYFPPVVDYSCACKSPARLGERLIVRTRFERPEAAILSFKYEVVRAETRELVATGATRQVLLDARGVLLYRFPRDVAERLERVLDYLEGKGGGGSGS